MVKRFPADHEMGGAHVYRNVLLIVFNTHSKHAKLQNDGVGTFSIISSVTWELNIGSETKLDWSKVETRAILTHAII